MTTTAARTAGPLTRVPLAIEDALTVLIMALLALITFANVVVRYFTSASFAWTEEISIFLMVLLTVVGGSAAFARNRHIRIDLLVQRGSPRRQRALARSGTAMVVLLFGMMAVLGARMVWDEYLFEETSPGIGVPQWWYTIWLPICCALIALRALGLYIRQSRAALHGRPDHIRRADRSEASGRPHAGIDPHGTSQPDARDHQDLQRGNTACTGSPHDARPPAAGRTDEGAPR